MSNDALSTATYAAMIEELQSNRDEIDRSIAVLRKLMAAKTAFEPPAQPAKPKASRELLAMQLGDACAWLLRERAIPMTNRDIVNGLLTLGYKKAKQTDNVNSALRYRADEGERDVVREGKHWQYVGKPTVVPAPQPTVAKPAAAAAPPPQVAQPRQQPAPTPVQAQAPVTQKGTPSPANGVSALR